MYNKKKRQVTDDIEDYTYNLSSSENVESSVLDKINTNNILKVIEELPKHYSDVFLLKYIHNLSDKDIAASLSVGESTIRKRIERGRKIIAERLMESDND